MKDKPRIKLEYIERVEKRIMFCVKCDKPSMKWNGTEFLPNCPHVPKNLRLAIL